MWGCCSTIRLLYLLLFHISYFVFIINNVVVHGKELDECQEGIQFPLNKVKQVGIRSTDQMFKKVEYMLKKGVTELTLNCTSQSTPFWRIYLASASASSKVEFFLKYTTDKKSGIKKNLCHTTSITLTNINENNTGMYGCYSDNKVLNGSFVFGLPNFCPFGLYLYGGSPENIRLINAGREFQFQRTNLNSNAEDTYFQRAILLPCDISYPDNITFLISRKTTEKVINSSMVLCGDDDKNYCLPFQNVIQELKKFGRIGGPGFALKCRTNESSVVVDVNPMPDFDVYPIESQIRIHAHYGESFQFVCKSIIPISIFTDYPFDQTTATTKSRSSDFLFQAKLNIEIPASNVTATLTNIFAHTLTPERENADFNQINLTVWCTSGVENDVKHKWTYTLENSYKDFEGEFLWEAGDKIQSWTDGYKSASFNKFGCLSPAPETFNISFVPCSTLYECQMKSSLLYDDEFRITKPGMDDRSVWFTPPANVSGMARCIGFQKDIMSFLYIGLEPPSRDGRRPTYVLPYSNENNDISQGIIGERKSLLVTYDKNKVFENETVIMTCTVPLMIIVQRPYWEFRYRNGTSVIIDLYLLEEVEVGIVRTKGLSSLQDEFLVIANKIRLPSVDIIGVACVIRVTYGISPLKWREGFLEENARHIKIDYKEEMIPIKVEAKPVKETNDSHVGFILGTTIGVILLITLSLSILIFYHIRNKSEFGLSKSEVNQFREGWQEGISESQTPNGNENAINLPYEKTNEIDLDDLDIDYNNCLGSGEFGVVFLSTLIKDGEPLTVAVKTTKPGANLRVMLAELKVMLFLKVHVNVVGILGAFTLNIEKGQLLVALEFCKHGNLLNYLRTNSNSFTNLVSNGYITPEDPLRYGYISCAVMTTRDLLRWSSEIANGMEYISNKNVIHGDLAARNILIADGTTVKISDFGLSKKLYKPIYVSKSGFAIPYQWTAPESLQFSEYSLASDVWSFGVTLWEIFTLGKTPYPFQPYNEMFLKMLEDGLRLPMPEYGTYEAYDIMMACWRRDPRQRPEFSTMKSRLDIMFKYTQK